MSHRDDFTNQLDSIDAAVFSSDMLFDDDMREMLKEHVARWGRAIESWEKTEASASTAPEDAP